MVHPEIPDTVICLDEVQRLEKEGAARNREAEVQSLAQGSSLRDGRAGSKTHLSYLLPAAHQTTLPPWWHQDGQCELRDARLPR